MNVYLIGMIIAMVIFLIIGFVVSKKVQSAEDFYVAGRQAPVILIAGSLVASYSSTGMFMGDAGIEKEIPAGQVSPQDNCVNDTRNVLFGHRLRCL